MAHMSRNHILVMMVTVVLIIATTKNVSDSQMVDNACNPIYTRGRNQEGHGLRLAQAPSFRIAGHGGTQL
jgi:hypothetical protein